MALTYFDSRKKSKLDFVKSDIRETILSKIDMKSFKLESLKTKVSDDIILSLGFQSVHPKSVLLKAIIAWAMADEVGRGAIIVCCMNGNRHGRLMKKGRVDAAHYLSPLVVDSQGPTDLTLGRFLVSLGCVFVNNVKDWHMKNSSHAGYTERVFKASFLNFLDIQLTHWKLYNPKKVLDLAVITRTANIMCQQRASCVLFLEDQNPFVPMTQADFIAKYGIQLLEIPACNPSPPCATQAQIEKAISEIADDDIRGLTTRTSVGQAVKMDPQTSSSSSSEVPPVKKTSIKHTDKFLVPADPSHYFDGDGYLRNGDGRIITVQGRLPDFDTLLGEGLIAAE